MASVRRALIEGAIAVEVDLCRTRDGRIVLWRDRSPNERAALARQAGLVGLYAVPEVPRVGSWMRRPVDELELAQMRATHAYHRRRGILSEVLGLRLGRRIPFETLEDLLAATPGLPGLQDLYLDLRLGKHVAPEVFRLTARLMHHAASRNGNGPLNFHVMTPHVEVFSLLREAASRSAGNILAYVDLMSSGFLAAARRLRARRVTCRPNGRPWGAFLKDLGEILRARARGEIERVAVWTVNDRARLKQLLSIGPDAILTDDVPLALRLTRPMMNEERERAVSGLAPAPEGVLTLG